MTAVCAPDHAAEEIAEIAQRLREQAGLPKTPTGTVASSRNGRGNSRTAPETRSPGKKAPARKGAAKKKAARAKG